ncbi:MAG: DIP1984 family protein [Prevotella sp.]|nr:DIP1984 family protein [Alistipes senegalensis]MCM1357962.1 DIP1984 family protein [Prevotella sp.]MCM1473410.1 DIP1984 family protein [Muribaculaceae bacterium]
MKLAEALALRAEMKTKIGQLAVRLNQNAKVQEGEKPAENPYTLIAELDSVSDEMAKLIKNINYTNCITVENGISLTDMIAEKDVLKKKISVMRAFISRSGEVIDRYSNKEIKVHSTVDVAELQKKVDTMSKQLRELDVNIQRINWTVDLIEK